MSGFQTLLDISKINFDSKLALDLRELLTTIKGNIMIIESISKGKITQLFEDKRISTHVMGTLVLSHQSLYYSLGFLTAKEIREKGVSSNECLRKTMTAAKQRFNCEIVLASIGSHTQNDSYSLTVGYQLSEKTNIQTVSFTSSPSSSAANAAQASLSIWRQLLKQQITPNKL